MKYTGIRITYTVPADVGNKPTKVIKGRDNANAMTIHHPPGAKAGERVQLLISLEDIGGEFELELEESV